MIPSTPTPPSLSAPADDYIVQLALDRGLLHPAQVDATRALIAGHSDASTPAPRVLDLLIQQGALTSRRVAEMLAAEFG